jgi:hypothetical protein
MEQYKFSMISRTKTIYDHKAATTKDFSRDSAHRK